MSKPFLLIDGDLSLFRGCAAVEKEVRWDDEHHVLFSNGEEAWDAVNYEVKKLLTRFKVTEKDCLICLSAPGGGFRFAIDPTYKGNRAKQRKPMAYYAVKQRLMDTYETREFPGLEADDVLGILATKPGSKRNLILCSEDKDMKTIPCTLYRQGKVEVITPPEADYWHLYQTLTGDTTDGYPGCPGMGPKTAEKLLAGGPAVDVAWKLIVETYAKKGLTEADALKQARLARILRWSDWDSEKKEPKLWTPTSAA